MKQGDKFQHRKTEAPMEVIEDAGQGKVTAKNLETDATEEVPYHQIDTDLPRCARCGRPRPQAELKSGVIYFRNRRPNPRKRGGTEAFCDQKTQLFCIDKPCHSHEQMAHEG